MDAFEIRNLIFRYNSPDRIVLDNINLSVSKGEFFVLCGYSGSGKTTLLRLLKPSLFPNGEKSGTIHFFNDDIEKISEFEASSKIGFVMQSPDSQMVTDKVWHELAFSLESLGYDSETIHRRVAEMSAFFGLDNLLYADVASLSGGQKQLLCLASVMALKPDVIILDEPTSQLDPVSASDFLAALYKINRETGITVILSEHRLEEALAYADKAAVMEDGKIIAYGTAIEISEKLRNEKSEMFEAMPTPVRVWGSVKTEEKCPLTVNEGRMFLEKYKETHSLNNASKTLPASYGEQIICADNIWFRYERELPDVLKGFSFSAYSGEIYSIFGSNGSGKTTALKVLSGIKKPYRGNVSMKGKIGYLPQEVSLLFVKKTVFDDLYDVIKREKISEEEKLNRINDVIEICRIENILESHPYDISGGEMQKAALAEILLMNPDILLLDEPTKGLDASYKRTFGNILTDLKKRGKAVILVSHDVEFCAEYSDRCSMFFDGRLVSTAETKIFFKGNSFYTTAADLMSRDIIPDVLTQNDITRALGGEIVEYNEVMKTPHRKTELPVNEVKKLPLWRKIGASIFAAAAVILMIFASLRSDIVNMVSSQGVTQKGFQQLLVYGVFILTLILLAIFLGQKEAPEKIKVNDKKGKLPLRTIISLIIIIALIPITLLIGVYLLPSKHYYILSLALIIECILPFIIVFEGRKTSAGQIVTISVLCAVAIAGRTAYFMLPQFKPVAAIVIIAGIMLGAESGFVVGAVSMFVSNMLFSQGPWTPWQMFGMGFIGFIAGILAKKGVLRKSRIMLSLFGFLSTLIIYGVIVNASTALLWGGDDINMKIFIGYFITGFPMDLIHASSTFIFLWFGSEPMIDILERVKVKYNIS